MKNLVLLIALHFLILSNGISFAQWVQVNESNNSWRVTCLLINGTNIFEGTDIGNVYLSTDIGTTWTQVGLTNCSVNALVSDGTNILAGTNGGMFLSTN